MAESSDCTPQLIRTRGLGPYQVQRELGRNREGGRITYLATHSTHGQAVVLKLFRFVQTDMSWSGFKSYEREIAILLAIYSDRCLKVQPLPGKR